MEEAELRDFILEVLAEALRVQARALAGLRSRGKAKPGRSWSLSHSDMAHAALVEAGRPLHVLEIIARIRERHSVTVMAGSLTSALLKCVQSNDRFTRTEPNTFGLIAWKN